MRPQDYGKYFLAHFSIPISHQLVSALLGHNCIHRLDFEVKVSQLADVPHPVPLELNEKLIENDVQQHHDQQDHYGPLWIIMDHHHGP